MKILKPCFILSLIFGTMFSQNISKEISELNQFLRRQQINSASLQALKIVDSLLLYLENEMLNAIPNLDNYKLINTNTFSRITMEKGDYEIELYSQKFFSNENCLLTLSIDATENVFQKNYNLYVSYDYLSERKNYKKIELKNKSTSIPVIVENNIATLLYITDTNQTTKGYSIKMEYYFIKKYTEKNKEDLIINDARKLALEIDKSNLKKIFK